MVYRIVMYVIHVRGMWIDLRPEELAREVAQEVLMCCIDRDRGDNFKIQPIVLLGHRRLLQVKR